MRISELIWGRKREANITCRDAMWMRKKQTAKPARTEAPAAAVTATDTAVLLALPNPPAAPSLDTSLPMASCVKIWNNLVAPCYLRPWTRSDGETCTGSGFAIETAAGPRILTNSHVVHRFQMLQVSRHDRPGKWKAEVEVEGVQCDLALIVVDAGSFWEGVPLLRPTDAVPALQHTVTAIGYPVGGDNLSVTRGVVSRIDLLDYTFVDKVQSERLLVLQIDAAINPDNSGGPVRALAAPAVSNHLHARWRGGGNGDSAQRRAFLHGLSGVKSGLQVSASRRRCVPFQVIDDRGQIVGVAFAGLDEADNIGQPRRVKREMPK